MALTNLSAMPHYKEKIVSLGAWSQASETIMKYNPENSGSSPGQN